MSRPVVCDAAAVVALLLDDGPDGRWATERFAGAALHAPTLLDFEVSTIVRRLERARVVSTDQANQAHADLLDLPVTPWPYEVLAARTWELRENLTSYDGSYVALAELLDAPLVTLDRRISRAPQVGCPVLVPDGDDAG